MIRSLGRSFGRNLDALVSGITAGLSYSVWHNFWLSVPLAVVAFVAYHVVDPLCRIFWYNHLGGKEKYERRYGDNGTD